MKILVKKYYKRFILVLICLVPVLLNAQNIIIESNINGTGSLIVDTSGVDYNTEVQRYIPSSNWHLISSPVSGQPLGAFVTSNQVVKNNTANDYDLAPYNEPSNGWSPYTLETNTDFFDVAKGYSMRRSSNGEISFEGKVNSGTYTIPVNRTNQNLGWNAIGNPYTSIIRANGTNGFFDVNQAVMDPSYIGLYVWDQSLDDYTIIQKAIEIIDTTALEQPAIAAAQGFIIKAIAGGGTITFTRQMQLHSLDVFVPFKSANVLNAKIKLLVNTGSQLNSTLINLNSQCTKGLDPGYDVGKLKGNPNLAMYSQLEEDNGVEFAIQSLPMDDYLEYRIPIGLDFPKGGFVTFTADYTNLMANAQVILEDTETNTFTRLDGENKKYVTLIDEEQKGYGRFYLHTSDALITSIDERKESDFQVFSSPGVINVLGETKPDTEFRLYSSDGKLYYQKRPQDISRNTISTRELSSGIYMLHIYSAAERTVHKVFVTGR